MMDQIPKTTLDRIARVAEESGARTRKDLFDAVCARVETFWPEDRWEERAKEARLDTTGKIHAAVDLYLLRGSPSFPSQPQAVTKGALRVVDRVAGQIGSTDPALLLDAVCDYLFTLYKGNSLDYHLNMMNIRTTTDIRYAIDLYRLAKEYDICCWWPVADKPRDPALPAGCDDSPAKSV